MPGAARYISPSDRRRVQPQLNQAGYDARDVDGTADEPLSSALDSDQEAEGLEPTGTPPPPALVCLLRCGPR